MNLRLALTSDLHGYLPALPPAEIGIVAGDIHPDFDTNPAEAQFRWWMEFFLPWATFQPVKVLLVIWGNHDWLGQAIYRIPDSGLAVAFRHALQRHNEARQGPQVIVLTDEAYVYRYQDIDVRFYGVPWVPSFHSWAFMMDDTGGGLGVKFEHMPLLTDVLITHGPPEFGTSLSRNWQGQPCGSRVLAQYLKQSPSSLKAVVCGHIHEGYGLNIVRRGSRPDLDVYNVAHCNARNRPTNDPVVVDLVIT